MALGVGAAKRETGAGRGVKRDDGMDGLESRFTSFGAFGGACGRGMGGGGELIVSAQRSAWGFFFNCLPPTLHIRFILFLSAELPPSSNIFNFIP